MTAKAGVGALGAALLAVLVFLAISSWSRQPAAAAKPSAQPINFPHNVHAGTYKIDCQYCHSDARRSEYAGLPSVERCMGCHKIAAADKPEIKKIAEFFATKTPIFRSSRTSRTRRTSARVSSARRVTVRSRR